MKKLRWITPAKYKKESKIPVNDIVEITFGFQTALFKKHSEALAEKEDLAVSIKYIGSRGVIKDLNVVFLNPQHMHLFVTGLQYTILKEECGLVMARQ